MGTYYYEVKVAIVPAGGQGEIPAEVEAEKKANFEQRLKNLGVDFNGGRIWLEAKEYLGG